VYTGNGLLLGGQPCPHLKRAGSQRSPILGVPFYLCVHTLSHNYQYCNTRLAVSHASHPKRAEFQCSPIFWVLLYLCLHPLHRTTRFCTVTHLERNVLLGRHRHPRHCVCTNASRGFAQGNTREWGHKQKKTNKKQTNQKGQINTQSTNLS